MFMTGDDTGLVCVEEKWTLQTIFRVFFLSVQAITISRTKHGFFVNLIDETQLVYSFASK